MNFYPSATLFFGVGIAAGVVACLMSIVVHEIDALLVKRACEKALEARVARRAQCAQRAHDAFEAAHGPAHKAA